MNTSNLFKKKRVLSFEIFPPKRESSSHNIYDTIGKLSDLNPDFISVTYGAGGSKNKRGTFEIASDIKNIYGIESVVHLPGIYLTKEEVTKKLQKFQSLGIKNILALRGDKNPDNEPKNDFKYASELISFIKEKGDFNVIAACYPEGHIESSSLHKDIENLKIKVDSGASQLITQVFFDNEHFYSFQEKTASLGINVPIEAGIMPVISKRQIDRITSLSRVSLPKKFLSILNRYENNPIAMRDAGIAYAIDQIVDLITHGVDGIHLYTMNNSYVTHKIFEAIDVLLAA